MRHVYYGQGHEHCPICRKLGCTLGKPVHYVYIGRKKLPGPVKSWFLGWWELLVAIYQSACDRKGFAWRVVRSSPPLALILAWFFGVKHWFGIRGVLIWLAAAFGTAALFVLFINLGRNNW
jgi:hypothetical protein